MRLKQPKHFQIILAIARKDITQAIKDHMTLGIIIGLLFLILPSQLIPLILQNESTPLAVIYSPESTSLAQNLADVSGTSAIQVNSLADLEDEIASGRSQVIGLALPEDFSEIMISGETVKIDGYLPHWAKPEESNQLIQDLEEKMQTLIGSTVEITVVDDQVHPDENTRGSEVMFVLQMVNASLLIALVLVPQLIMVEKQTHTLDALLVSPATLPDLLIGKCLTGVLYSTAAGLLVILMNVRLIAHWWLLIAANLSGIIFAVSMGLLIGLIFEDFKQATMSMYMVVMLVLAPPLIKLIFTVKLPDWIDLFVNWLPSSQLAQLSLMSLMKSLALNQVLLGLAAIWLGNLILFGLNFWQIRQKMR